MLRVLGFGRFEVIEDLEAFPTLRRDPHILLVFRGLKCAPLTCANYHIRFRIQDVGFRVSCSLGVWGSRVGFGV